MPNKEVYTDLDGMGVGTLRNWNFDPVLTIEAASFTFIQGVPSAFWDITHTLGYKPAITVVDSSGRRVYGDVQYLSVNHLTVTFSAPFSGEAYLS